VADGVPAEYVFSFPFLILFSLNPSEGKAENLQTHLPWIKDLACSFVPTTNSSLQSEILRWKINHNVFESQEMAAEGRAQVELDRQGSVRACIQFPYLPGCKKTLQEDAAIKNEKKEQNEAAAKQAKEQEGKAAAVAKQEEEQREKAAAERKEKERERKDAAKEKEKVWREKADVAAKKKKEQKEKNAAEKQEKEQGSDGVEPSS
jgi:hypothetical protein